MKSRIKLNLGNIAGAIISAVPELKDKVDIKALGEIALETEVEFSVSEAIGMTSLAAQLAHELPDLIADIYKNVLDNIADVDIYQQELTEEYEKYQENKTKEDAVKDLKKDLKDEEAVHNIFTDLKLVKPDKKSKDEDVKIRALKFDTPEQLVAYLKEHTLD